MSNFLYGIVSLIANLHNTMLSWNDQSGYGLNDKQMHFVIIGIFGMLMVFIIQPIFKALADRGHTLVITWIYVFTLIIVITFAIEIGQGYTGTGAMEFEDIMFGIVGFLAMFAVFAFVRWVCLGIIGWFRSKKKKKR